MSAQHFDFLDYINRRKAPKNGREEKWDFGEYAFAGDLRALRRLDRGRAVRTVVKVTVRFWKAMHKGQLLGSSEKVSRRQFPELFDLVVECAQTLDITFPTVYISQSLSGLNTGTYGTDDEAFLILNAALVDRLDEGELKFVIGHECGHIQNNHVAYHTAARYLSQDTTTIAKQAVVPARVALNGWSRRGEITCDRAGIICCRDEEVALRTIMKLELGSEEYADEGDRQQYLAQLDESEGGLGRFQEYLTNHPSLSKRLKALKIFAQSSYYRQLIGERGGEPLDEVDRAVDKVIQVL